MSVEKKKVNLSSVAAAVLWVVSVLFVLAGTIVVLVSPREIGAALALMAHGIVCSAGAATVTVRCSIDDHERFMAGVFELGRDTGLGVRQMRGTRS